MKSFWFDGRCSREFGMMPTGAGMYNAPERDMEFISIEGRNGDLIIDKGRFKNVPLQIPVSICKDFPEKAAAARRWLLGGTGYRRLESDYDPDHFRLAAFTGPLDFDVKFQNRAAEAVLEFNCKPQRFLKSGEATMIIEESCELCNPTDFEALPIIVVTGSEPGSLTVNDVTVEIFPNDENVVIRLDSETQNAGYPTKNQNDLIRAKEFPVLKPGNNKIILSGGVYSLILMPRWWTI